mgnify:CR=1 FL=1
MFSKILECIKSSDRIVIYGHIHPDGDSYGSAIGLKEIIKENFPNKEVYALGSGLPSFHNLISPIDVIDDSLTRDCLAILVDSNSLNRSEDKRIYNASKWCKIDHHIDLHDFTEGPEVIVEDAVSTCEIIYDFAKSCSLKINKIAANALFLGILTDSGRFQYYVDFEGAFSRSLELVRLGATPNKIFDILNVRTIDDSKITGYFYSNYKVTSHGVIYIRVPLGKVMEFGGDAIGIANCVRLLTNIKGYDIAVCFSEIGNNEMVMEFRSPCYNVQKIAAKYGGGGHAHAAGLTVNGCDSKYMQLILDDLDNLIISGEKE